MALKYNERTGMFEEVPYSGSEQKENTPCIRGNSYIQSHIAEIKRFYIEGKTFAARKFFVDAYGCTWDKAQELLIQSIGSNTSLSYSSSRNVTAQSSTQTPARQMGSRYISDHLSEIKRLYNEGKTFAARKFFVDAYGCSWDEAQIKLETMLRIPHIVNSQNRVAQASSRKTTSSPRTYIDNHRNEILKFNREGKSFAARKFFVDAYNCSWSQAQSYLNEFLIRNR